MIEYGAAFYSTRERSDERGLTERHVKDALVHPDKVGGSLRNRERFIIKKIYFNEMLGRKHLLMIIGEESGDDTLVITIIDTSKIDKYY